jgi:EAL domain-containing protein (putative c-di-GMP-specific phosphodiesterase class I)/GGDEF domain-containing protein
MLTTRHLTRNYSIASLIGIALVAVTMVYYYQSLGARILMESESSSNSNIARTIANALWPKYADFVTHAGQLPAAELAAQPTIENIRQDILHKVTGLRVVKVKIYDIDGVVVFSTEAAQIGGDKASNKGFLSARAGHAASDILFSDTFSSFEGSIYDRDLVSSYVPVRSGPDQPVEGVLEIYSDVTPLLAEIESTSHQVLLVVTSLMLLLYLFLLLIVRRAHLQLQASEVHQQREQQQRFDYLEFHDEMTGLLNRKGLTRQFRHYDRAKRVGGTGLGVVALKLLNLNDISSGLGRQRAMPLLQLAAERLRVCVAGSHNMTRLDSGEFILVVENLFSRNEMDFTIGKITGLFAAPFTIEDKRLTLTIAMGIDISWSGRSTEYMVNNAQLALGECESRGVKQSLYYDESMELKKQEALNLEVDIGQALQRREFVVYYQPKVGVQSGMVCGMEALVRWNHPRRGLVLPGGFIPLLEARGYIVELGRWVLQESCMQCQRWHEEGQDGLRVAVNVSLKQLLSRGFVEDVTSALQQSRLPATALELELTESILADDTAVVGERLRQLKALGVRLAIDDFGTGYSSLSYLMHFPFDTIKIDRAFIRDMMHNHTHAVLTGAIITMARSLNLSVVAEGVETVEQLARVQEMGCDEMQGFYFSPAVAVPQFVEVVAVINTAASSKKSKSRQVQSGTQADL